MSAELPDELKYLKPALGELDKFDPDELGGDNPEAMDIVEAALEPVLRDLSEVEAVELLKKHEWQSSTNFDVGFLD